MPCDPINASTISVSGFAKLGTLGTTNSINLCSSSGRGAYSIQGPIFGT